MSATVDQAQAEFEAAKRKLDREHQAWLDSLQPLLERLSNAAERKEP